MESYTPRQALVPVDFSDFSLAAVDVAVKTVADPSNVHVVHVLPDERLRSHDLVWKEIDHIKREQHARQELERRLNEAGHTNLEIEVRFGDPGHEITELANRLHADLIVIPSHGRTGLKRLIIGSVAERVVRLAHCPVLVLRA